MPAAEAAGISVRTTRKLLKRFDLHRLAVLHHRSSRPAKTRTNVRESLRQRIEQLRRARMPMRNIARIVGRSVATVIRWLARLGLSSLKALDPVVRYERHDPGELLRMETKKLGRIVQPSHRVTGARRDPSKRAELDFVHVAIDDHSRASFVQVHEDEREGSATGSKAAVALRGPGCDDQALHP